MEIKRPGSRPSGKGPAEWFTGNVRVDPLFEAPEPARAAGALVTFELSIWRDLIPRFTSHARAASIAGRLGWVPTKRYTGIVIYAADPLPVHGTDRRELLQPAMLPGLYYLAEPEQLVRIAEAQNYDPAALATWGAFGYTASIAEADLALDLGPLGQEAADVVLSGVVTHDSLLAERHHEASLHSPTFPRPGLRRQCPRSMMCV